MRPPASPHRVCRSPPHAPLPGGPRTPSPIGNRLWRGQPADTSAANSPPKSNPGTPNGRGRCGPSPRTGGSHSSACVRPVRSSSKQVRTPKRPVTSHAAQKNRDSPPLWDEEPRVDIPGAGGRERATGGTEQASEHVICGAPSHSVRAARTNPADQQALTPSRTVAGADEGSHQTLATRRKERRGRPT